MINGEVHPTEVLLTNIPTEREVYLKTIMIRLRHKGKEICVRALMDDCSHHSYAEKGLVEELKLGLSGKETFSQGLFGGGISPAVEHGRCIVTVENVEKDTPPIRIPLGADTLGSILTGSIEVFPFGFSAVETSLGWAILGLGNKTHIVNMVTLNLQSIEVSRIWDLEVLGITDPVGRKNKILL
ncbi:uncharacterized protein TNCV_3914721 [Trichonephila clavipes]|nr:uncharacterized protein TNCV_3914721 [Trichonephila clavipes]